MKCSRSTWLCLVALVSDIFIQCFIHPLCKIKLLSMCTIRELLICITCIVSILYIWRLWWLSSFNCHWWIKYFICIFTTIWFKMKIPWNMVITLPLHSFCKTKHDISCCIHVTAWDSLYIWCWDSGLDQKKNHFPSCPKKWQKKKTALVRECVVL